MFNPAKTFLPLLILFLCSTVNADHLRVGYDARLFKIFGEKDVEVATKVWVEEILRDLHQHTFSFRFYDDIEELAADVAADRVDFIVADGLSFVRYFDLDKLADGFNAGALNREDSVYVVVIRADEGIEGWHELKGKTFAVQENDPVAELYLQYRMRLHNGSEAKSLQRYEKRDRVLLKLFFGKADAAVVPKRQFELAVELNPQMGQRLKIMEVSQIPSYRFGLFRKALDPGFAKEVTDLAVAIDHDERGKQLLMIYQTEKLIITRVSDLEPIRRLDAAYEKMTYSK